MLVPDFGPTMNVIAYSPFHDGVSAEAVGGSDRAIVSGAAHKPTRLLRRSGAIGFSSRPATALEQACAATTLDVYPTCTLLPTKGWAGSPRQRPHSSRSTSPRSRP